MTEVGSSPMESPRFSGSWGGWLTPPQRLVMAVRTPGTSSAHPAPSGRLLEEVGNVKVVFFLEDHRPTPGGGGVEDARRGGGIGFRGPGHEGPRRCAAGSIGGSVAEFGETVRRPAGWPAAVRRVRGSHRAGCGR